jgi:hypothetical protein
MPHRRWLQQAAAWHASRFRLVYELAAAELCDFSAPSDAVSPRSACSAEGRWAGSSATILLISARKASAALGFLASGAPTARIAKHSGFSGECFVLALIYIDRVIQRHPHFVLNAMTIHRLFITAVMLGAKFFDDKYFNNASYAKVGGVPVDELNSLEVEFLKLINFSLYFDPDTFRQFYMELCNHAARGTCACSSRRAPPPVPPRAFGSSATPRPSHSKAD